MYEPEPEAIAAALALDPLAEAERATGKSYKDDPGTLLTGMSLALVHGHKKEALLKATHDSFFSMNFAQQLAVFADLGFEEVYRETFAGRYGPDDYVILWHPDGLLATCESHETTHRNDAKVYYNYRHKSGGFPHGLFSSGSMHGEVWVGDHNAREGIRHKLDAMRAEGTFLPEWVARPFLWLLNYSETDGEYDSDAINARKIAQLPEHVRLSITPELQAARAES